MVRHTLLVTCSASSPGGSLPFCFSRSFPYRAETCFFVSLCSPCLSFNPCRWPAGSLCWWPFVWTSSLVNLAWPVEKSKRSWGRKKVQQSFLTLPAASFKGHVRRTESVCGFLRKRPVHGWLNFETFLPDTRNRQLADGPTKAKPAKKRSDFRKSWHVQIKWLGGVFERQGLVCFVKQRHFGDWWFDQRRMIPNFGKLSSASSRCTYSLRNPKSVEVPLCSTSAHLSSFLPSCSILWDTLPASVTSCSSLSSFASSLDSFFVDDKFSFGLPP